MDYKKSVLETIIITVIVVLGVTIFAHVFSVVRAGKDTEPVRLKSRFIAIRMKGILLAPGAYASSTVQIPLRPGKCRFCNGFTKVIALKDRPLQRCSECRGKGTVWDFSYQYDKTKTKRTQKMKQCGYCLGTGRRNQFLDGVWRSCPVCQKPKRSKKDVDK